MAVRLGSNGQEGEHPFCLTEIHLVVSEKFEDIIIRIAQQNSDFTEMFKEQCSQSVFKMRFFVPLVFELQV